MARGRTEKHARILAGCPGSVKQNADFAEVVSLGARRAGRPRRGALPLPPARPDRHINGGYPPGPAIPLAGRTFLCEPHR